MNPMHYLRTEAIGDVLLLELQDRTGILPDHSISHELDKLRKERRDAGFTKVVFDFGQASFFGSSLLELIRVVWSDLTTVNGQLVLCNPSAFGREVLELAKFDQVWTIVDNRTQAFELLNESLNIRRWPQSLQTLIADYESGPQLLRDSTSGLSSIRLRTPAPPGEWSVLQIVCHIADFELVYSDRMKRVVAEDQPLLQSGDPDLFAAKLAYSYRELDEELDVVTSVRKQTSRFLKTLGAEVFERTGRHSSDGPLSLLTLLQRITGHIPHHVKFIEGKKANFDPAE